MTEFQADGVAPTDQSPRWRRLALQDIDAIEALHRSAIAAVGDPTLVRAETRSFFEALLSHRGMVLGIEDREGLLAYGVLQWQLPAEEDLRHLFGLSPEAPFAKLAGASVRPGVWGKGLHEAVILERVTHAAELGYAHLYATSAPGNARSWTNLLNQGFRIYSLMEQYGGALRYIFYRVATDFPHLGEEEMAAWCAPEDTAEQRRYLAEGLVGTRWRKTANGGREIGWVHAR